MNRHQQKLITYCYDLLAKRRYSIRDMVKKLEARNNKYETLCTDQELQQILESLCKANLLNDQDYADFYLDWQIRRKPVGKIKIRQQLRLKGIDENLIAQAFNKAELDEFTLAKKLLAKKAQSYQSQQLKDPKIRARLLRFLASNGYNSATSYRALKDLHPNYQSRDS